MNDILNMMKEKAREAMKNPGALFGLLYPYLLVIIVIIGLYYVGNLENIARQKVPAFLPDTTVIADLPVQSAKSVPPVDINTLSKPTDELLTEGEKLYKANCSSCHGDNGVGGGPASMGLNPAPRNFTDSNNWKNGRSLSGIYTTLEEGISGGAMVAYDYLLPKEKIALGHYIRQTFMTDAPEDTQSELDALDLTYNLSAGQMLPAQIPVASAELLILSENQSKLDAALNYIDEIENDFSQGARLFKKVSDDLNRSVYFLVRNNGWKQNERKFIEDVINNVNQNGFNGRVFNLSDDEWNSLFSYLTGVI